MSEKRFKLDYEEDDAIFIVEDDDIVYPIRNDTIKEFELQKLVDKLNEQQELIEELQVSDEMGWKRAEHFEKKCPKELHNKKMYIKRLKYKVQKFKEENEQLKQKIQRWKNLYKLKDAEVTARVDGLNKVCEYYLTEAQFKSDTDPNDAVKEVINEILNTEVEMW